MTCSSMFCLFAQYETLSVFDTSQNITIMWHDSPTLPWKDGQLPGDEPENTEGNSFRMLQIMLKSFN